MRFRQKLTLLLIIWTILGIGVVLVWVLKKNTQSATVVLLPSVSPLVKGGWLKIDSAVSKGHIAAVFYEGNSTGVSNYFSSNIEPLMHLAVNERQELKLINITPDSIHYLSVAKSMSRLELAEIDSMYSEELQTLRRKAFFDRSTEQVQRLDAFNAMRGKKNPKLYSRLSKRYSELLTQRLYKEVDLIEGKRVLMIVDIINYHQVKRALVNNPSIKLEDEI